MRFNKLDLLRGATLVSMILYHALWDVNFIFGHYMKWYNTLPGSIWQQSICITFILLSGFCAGMTGLAACGSVGNGNRNGSADYIPEPAACDSVGNGNQYESADYIPELAACGSNDNSNRVEPGSGMASPAIRCHGARNSLKKYKGGLRIFVCGVLITLVTLIFMPEDRIIFGILTLIGSCQLIAAAAGQLLRKIRSFPGALIFFALFLIFKDASYGIIKIPGARLILPSGLFRNYFTSYLGFPFAGFYSTDYFPLIPWLFLFLTGFFLYGILKDSPLLHSLENGLCPPLEWMGRHSLLIYLLHQPVIYAVLLLVESVHP